MNELDKKTLNFQINDKSFFMTRIIGICILIIEVLKGNRKSKSFTKENLIIDSSLFEDELKKALAKNKISEREFEDLLEANKILSNPIVKSDSWRARVVEYAKEYEKWKDSPDPKESWSNISQGLFGAWELPILEKERLLREAELMYSLSDDDIGAINTRFGAPMSGELLESVLSDLYEEEEGDDESTFETDSE